MADGEEISRIARLAEASGLVIASEHREGVALNFARIARMAALVMEHELSGDSEISLIFVP